VVAPFDVFSNLHVSLGATADVMRLSNGQGRIGLIAATSLAVAPPSMGTAAMPA
jgi:hypothetical protein